MDPRVARTRASLQHAVLKLARERGLDAATVGTLTEAAGVNRSTFYQHYPDKETLLADALDAALDDVAAKNPPASPPDIATIPPDLYAYLEHVKEHVDIYRRLLGDHWSSVVMARLNERLNTIIVNSLRQSPDQPFAGMPLDVAAAGICGASMGVVSAWISRDPLPPIEEAATWMWRVLRDDR